MHNTVTNHEIFIFGDNNFKYDQGWAIKNKINKQHKVFLTSFPCSTFVTAFLGEVAAGRESFSELGVTIESYGCRLKLH